MKPPIIQYHSTAFLFRAMADSNKLSTLMTLVLCATLATAGSSELWRQRLCDSEETFCRVGLCYVPECDICDHHYANCQTTNQLEPVPQTLPPDTWFLRVYLIPRTVSWFEKSNV